MTRPGTDLAAPLTDPAFHAGEPWGHYAALRARAPVAWNEELGFWALSRHADVLAVSRDPVTFCSSQGVLLMDLRRDLPELPGALLYVDPPEHQRYRRLVQPAFSPSRMRALEPAIRDRTRRLLDAVAPGTTVDVVRALALPLPLLVIADLLGLPDEDWERYAHWSDAAIDAGTAPSDEAMAALGAMAELFLSLVAERRARPADDLISVLASAEGAGEDGRLTDDELMMLCGQLLVAGNETTRNLISGGLVALADQPEQWDRLVADPSLVPSAVEELLRFTSPVISFLRTATADTEVGGQAIARGEPVLLLYTSANRDEAVFGEDAERVDVGRFEDQHLAFGFGEHFCLGAVLARIEARVVLDEVLARGWRPVGAGAPRRLASSAVVAGFLEAPLRFEEPRPDELRAVSRDMSGKQRTERGLVEGIEVVSLDAGGVLVVPRHDVLAEVLAEAGHDADPARFWAAHHRAMHAVDVARAEPESPEAFAEYLDGFLAAIDVTGTDRVEARRHLDPVFAPVVWCHPIPGALDGLRRLQAAGLRLVVTSNADGNAHRQLLTAGILQVGEGPGVAVEAIVDSGAAGVAKPDPAIFDLTARTMGVPVERVLHVGDSVHYDVEAAAAAGMVGVHMDPYDLCPDRTHPHVRSLADLLA